MNNIVYEMIGKTIVGGYADGFYIILIFNDGSIFRYEASDGGYSQYEFEKGAIIND